MAMNTSILPGDSQQQRQVLGTPAPGVPSQTWQMLGNQARTEPLPKNLDAVFDMGRGFLSRLRYRTGYYLKRARGVLGYDKRYAGMTDADLRAAAGDFRALFRTGRD